MRELQIAIKTNKPIILCLTESPYNKWWTDWVKDNRTWNGPHKKAIEDAYTAETIIIEGKPTEKRVPKTYLSGEQPREMVGPAVEEWINEYEYKTLIESHLKTRVVEKTGKLIRNPLYQLKGKIFVDLRSAASGTWPEPPKVEPSLLCGSDFAGVGDELRNFLLVDPVPSSDQTRALPTLFQLMWKYVLISYSGRPRKTADTNGAAMETKWQQPR